MKNLKKLEMEGLLSSKSYGLGKEKLWSIKRGKFARDLGYTGAKADVHSFKYEHEKGCAEVYVALLTSGLLLGWGGEGDGKIGLKYDRKFKIKTSVGESPLTYLELETGSQGEAKLREKLARYEKYVGASGEAACVLFTVMTEPELERLIVLFEEFRFGRNFGAVIHAELTADPPTARVTTRFTTLSFLDWYSK